MSRILLRLLRAERRAAVGVWVAISMPFLLGAMLIGLQVSSWWVDVARLQQAADAASNAGALTYKASLDTHIAATRAAYVAQLNGATGSGSPVWNSTTNTLTDGNITVAVTPGTNTASGTVVQVNIAQGASAAITPLPGGGNGTIHTASMAGIIIPASSNAATSSTSTSVSSSVQSNINSSGQPCMLALNGDSSGVTSGTDITFQGNVTISASGCTIRSDAGIQFKGNVTVSAADYYAGGTITTSGGAAQISGANHPNSSQIPDPYATDTTLQNALAAANGTTGGTDLSCNSSGCSGPSGLITCTPAGCTAKPGTYGNWTMSNGSTLTLSPGTYVFTGSIKLTGGILSGSGVTILMAAGSNASPNTATVVGNATTALRAATMANVGSTGAIPGVLFATLTTGAVSFGGTSSGLPMAGVIYIPNGSLKFAGTPVDGVTSCAEIIANTITVSGNVGLTSAGCAAYGVAQFGSLPMPPVLALIH